MTESTQDTQESLGDDGQTRPPEPEKPKARARSTTRYRILWAEVPEDGEDAKPIAFREIRNPDEKDGAYVATSSSTAKRQAFADDRAEAHPFIQQAIRRRGVELRHCPMESWGEDRLEPIKLETREELTTGTVFG